MFKFATILLSLISLSVFASVTPLPHAVTIELSDGRQITAIPRGHRDNHWLEIEGGRKIVERDGFWFYAAEDRHGFIVASDESLVDGIAIPPLPQLTVQTSASVVALSDSAQPQRIPYRYPADNQYFRQNLLVVRVAFADQGFRYSDAEVAASLFGDSNSVNHFFLENSYDNFDIQPAAENSGTVNDGIVTVRLSSNHPDFGTGYGVASQSLARAALAELPAELNLAGYDRNSDSWLDPNELAIVFLVAGYEQAYSGAGTSHPRVWAHKSSLYQGQANGMHIGEYAMFGERHQEHQATIGIICHELGHLLFDLPDLYDRYGKSMGIGRWGLMGLGGWNSAGGEAGNKPAHMLGWTKEQAGFLTPGHAAEGHSQIQLRAVTDAADVLEVHLDGYRHGQRLLLEHRRMQSYDSGLPGEGVLVTRVDDWVGYGTMGKQNDDVNNQLVDVEEADGGSDLDDNRNRGDADDVFRSSDQTLQFSSVNPSPSAHGASSVVELTRMEAGIVADIDIRIENPAHGDNLGYDEVSPASTWGGANATAQVVIELALDSNVVWIDGLDWFAPGEGSVGLQLFTAPPQYATEQQRIVSEEGFIVSSGWNRLMLPDRIENRGYSKLYLQITSTAADGYAPLAIDNQGHVSGKTQVRLATDEDYTVAPFDVPARLLVMNQDVPVSPGFTRTAEQSSSSGGSGGGVFWLLALLILVPRRQSI